MEYELPTADLKLFEKHMTTCAKEIASHIGIAATMSLVRAHGGQTFRLYRGGESVKAIMARAIGAEAANKLAAVYHNTLISIPMCSRAMRVIARERLRKEFDRLTIEESLSAREAVSTLAKRSDPPLHERSVWRILSSPDE